MIIFTPITDKAVEWVNTNVQWENWQEMGTLAGGIAIKTKMALPIVEAMILNGLKISQDFEIIRR